jgi:hypothetical protein
MEFDLLSAITVAGRARTCLYPTVVDVVYNMHRRNTAVRATAQWTASESCGDGSAHLYNIIMTNAILFIRLCHSHQTEYNTIIVYNYVLYIPNVVRIDIPKKRCSFCSSLLLYNIHTCGRTIKYKKIFEPALGKLDSKRNEATGYCTI